MKNFMVRMGDEAGKKSTSRRCVFAFLPLDSASGFSFLGHP